MQAVVGRVADAGGVPSVLDHTQGRSNAMLPRWSPHMFTLSDGIEERQGELPLVQGLVRKGKESAVKCHHQDH